MSLFPFGARFFCFSSAENIRWADSSPVVIFGFICVVFASYLKYVLYVIRPNIKPKILVCLRSTGWHVYCVQSGNVRHQEFLRYYQPSTGGMLNVNLFPFFPSFFSAYGTDCFVRMCSLMLCYSNLFINLVGTLI